MRKPLNIFYSEPDPDRWLPYDRYPRKLIRRLVRGKHRPGGVMMVALNLMKGLNMLGVPYRFNDHRYIKRHPEEVACIIGKPQVLFERAWLNPIIFGAGIYSHPIERPELLLEYPTIRRVLVPGEWMREMFEPFYGEKVISWPTGIDTNEWRPIQGPKTTDILIYDKVRWEHERYDAELIGPIKSLLNDRQLSYEEIRYGNYTHEDLKDKLSRASAVIFLCEHETQGLAYQQILSTGTPILAWDRGGYWQDPHYYPHRVKYAPVSSVPYWDDRCGSKFTGLTDLPAQLDGFITHLNEFDPRSFVVEQLSLKICAQKYLDIVDEVEKEMIKQ